MDKTFVIAAEQPHHAAAREALLDLTMGEIRFRRASARIREGRLASDRLSLVALDSSGAMLGTVRLWDIKAQGLRDAVLLGPLAVDPAAQGMGIGAALMEAAIERARLTGRGAILLVGDPAYYARFGFEAQPAARLFMPGPFERHRLLALELQDHALASAHGTIKAAGRRVEKSGRLHRAA